MATMHLASRHLSSFVCSAQYNCNNKKLVEIRSMRWIYAINLALEASPMGSRLMPTHSTHTISPIVSMWWIDYLFIVIIARAHQTTIAKRFAIRGSISYFTVTYTSMHWWWNQQRSRNCLYYSIFRFLFFLDIMSSNGLPPVSSLPDYTSKHK